MHQKILHSTLVEDEVCVDVINEETENKTFWGKQPDL